MEQSVLKTTKKILGIADGDTSFDLDVLAHINSAFSTLKQLGVVADDVIVEDDELDLESLELPPVQLGLVRTYIYLKVRIAFDPPATSFHIEAFNKQIEEHEGRLSIARESLIP